MKITLVRHGETEENYLRKLQGTKNVLMNDSGRRECQRLKLKLIDKHFDYCYMSPLVRCVETAMILVGDRVLTIPDNRLIERELGELEGRSIEEYNFYKFWNYKLNYSNYGVESIQSLFERCQSFLDYILEKHKGEDILIVTHSGVFRALHHLLKKNDLNSNLLGFKIPNCYMEEFEYE